MARFSFVKARKKESPQPNFAKPMSKAHKILGSTPISIDSLQPWDDVSSGFSGRISNTTPSYAYSEDDSSDYHVAIASSDYDSSNDSEIRLAALESSSLGSGSEDSMGDATHGPRKTQSTSTIRSWYDTSKESSPTSQQPQATSTVRGVPPKIHKMLDLESSPTAPKPKKKPPMLDFSNLRGSSRLSRKAPNGPTQSDSTIAKEFESPTVESPLSLAAPIGKPRKTHKRSTKDGAPSSDLKETHSTTVERRHRTGSTKEAPSLYDHYEQMTIRQLMHEDQKLKEEQQNDHGTKQQGTNTDDNEEPWTAQDSPWLQDTLPPTPQTAFMIGLTPAASHKRTNSAGSKMIANTKQSTTLGTSDLQATSMLMLSSDSEDDNEPTSLLPRWTTSLNNHSPSASGPLPLPPRVSSRASDHRPMRHSNKPSFASVNTYSTFLSNSRLSTATAIDANFESSMPYTSDFLSRTSSISDASRASALQPSANYVHEARAVNMLVGRRPMTVDNGEKNSPEELSSSSSLSPAARKALNLSQTPPEELTPPLSPTSVDFFLRSARSSVDGSGSQSRYMAVTRKEQMLLSALRNNKQYGKEQSFNTLQQCDQNSSTETLTTASTSEEVEEDEEDEGDEEEGESNSAVQRKKPRQSMEGWAHNGSDDESSMSPFQPHAVTDALLAVLDLTATASKDDARATDRRRNLGH
ncbi:hypothetical protein IF1G_03225 [Cordyceps javanica]|uniref:Uncharacterized protein n=1 Tax=Cordyceps javanica TaxID=43265 RepID=A0A545V6Y8_9HYPO|nr:hypothetical protein IF1G_03225 [Cordyceps javanica]TQW09330.1 prothymosin/parathymosin family domain-containing protein [Cordyceps javanica]